MTKASAARRILLIPLLVVFLAVFRAGTVSPAQAAAQESYADAADDILAFYKSEKGVPDVQGLVDGYLSDTAGESAEWFIWALRQYRGSYNFTSYSAALAGFLQENTLTNASTREKYALALLASGADSPYIREAADTAIGGMGVVSYIYGLHLLTNGVPSGTRTAQTVIDALLALAHTDGGWSVRADTSLPSDVDVTAMALQALAPYKEEPDVNSAIDMALLWLSEKQTAEGDYAAFGGRNAESCAQVLIALCALGIDPLTDARFLKNDNTVLDGMLRYRLPNGTYSHFAGENYSLSATLQAFTAYVALWRFYEGKTPFYILDDYNFAPPREAPGEESDAGTAGGFAAWKLWTAFCAAAGTVIVIVYLLLSKRGGLKECVVCALVGILCVGIVTYADIQSKHDYYNDRKPIENAISVTVTIRCDTLSGHNNSYLPDDCVILPPSVVQIEKGGTVFDAVKEAARRYVIPLEFRGEIASGATYVAGISHLYEFDYGATSGWMYAVNNVTTEIGCAEYALSSGDTVFWYYTLDLGRDADFYGLEDGDETP